MAFDPEQIAESATSKSRKVALTTEDGLPVNALNPLPTSATLVGGGGDGAILDGVSALIKATVLDYANSNPVAVRLTDTSGDYVSPSGGVTGGGTEAAALRVTVANDSTGVLSVDDNAGSLTVDGTVTANLSATDNAVLDQIELNQDSQTTLLTTIDSDTSDIKTALETAGGLVVNLGANNDVTNTVLSVVGGGTEATAQRVTIATDSTGVISVDDNGGALTVDGTITANAGTNLNTSALALESGGNLASAVTALQIIDNMISGSEAQVDVVTLPALSAGTNSIGKMLPPDIDVTTHTNYIKKYYTSTGAATDGIIWSPAAGKRWHVVSLFINVSAAATVTLEDDKAGGGEAVWKAEFAANSGAVQYFGEMYPLASGEDAADLIITTSAGNVYVTVVGFEI